MTEPNDEDSAALNALLTIAENTISSLGDKLEASRLALAASEARENALREALMLAYPVVRYGGTVSDAVEAQMRGLISAPRDSGALRAIVLRSLLEGGKYVAEPPCARESCNCVEGRVEDLADHDDPDTKAIVARILSGGADE